MEGSDYMKLYEVLSELKNKKLKINNIFTEKYKENLLILNKVNIQEEQQSFINMVMIVFD